MSASQAVNEGDEGREERTKPRVVRTAVAQEGAQSEARRYASILGQAGAALVEFQLARRGIVCVRMPESSPSGDIWAETDLGRIGIEVKTTNAGRSWFVRPHQVNAEFYVFVHLIDIECYILNHQEVQAACAALPPAQDGTYKLPRNSLPKTSREAWGRLGVGKAAALEFYTHLPLFGIQST